MKSRLYAAFVVPPLIPLGTYFAILAWMSSITPGAPRLDNGNYFLFLAAGTYVVTGLFWLPTYFVLQFRERNDRRTLLWSGATCFGLVAWGLGGFRPSMLPFALAGALVGFVFALAFCAIAGPEYVRRT